MASEVSFDKRPLAPLLFIAQTLLCQLVAMAVAVLTYPLVSSVALALILACLVAFFIALFLNLPTAWVGVNVLLPVGAASALAIDIPPQLFLALFLVTVCVYLPAFWTRVPYFPTQQAAYPLILAELPSQGNFAFIDVGCGFGTLLNFLSKKRPNGTFVGIEIGPLPYLVSRMKALISGRFTIHFQSMWNIDLGSFDYVYTFLSPAPMERLALKAQGEMTAGSTFISNSFPMPWEANETIQIRDQRASKLYIYKMKHVTKESV